MTAERGFSYVAVLTLLAAMSLGVAAMGTLWSADVRRECERELLRIGSLYANAIGRYHTAAPGGVRQYPASLDELLLDRRYLGTVRHLRRVYTDPTQPGRPWALIIGSDGAIRGVYSTSAEPPLRREPLDLGFTILREAKRYSEWHFVPSEPS